MEKVENELNLLKHDVEHMLKEVANHPIFTQINEWEQESTIKIQVTAELARADLFQLLETNTNRLQSDFNRISHQIEFSRSSNYSEMYIDQWINEIKNCRQDISKTFESVNFLSDPEIELVQFIRITESDGYPNPIVNSHTTTASPVEVIIPSSTRSSLVVGKQLRENAERFEHVAGDVELGENDLIAKKTSNLSASIRGAKLYSANTHQIRFRIEHLSNNSIFIGIIPSIQQMTTTSFKLPSVYGWWDTKFPVMGGIHVTSGAYSMRTGDEISLTLICDEARLVYHNKRSGFGKISVNLNSCPLPWQLLVVLGAGENIIRILPW
jgi:hypothetical protein